MEAKIKVWETLLIKNYLFKERGKEGKYGGLFCIHI
jgi:hypothetical protein